MSRSRTQKLLTRRIGGESNQRRPDVVLVEEPLTIRLNDTDIATTMRTPGHDFELAAGFVLGEGYADPSTIIDVRYCGTGSAVLTKFNVVSLHTAAPVEAQPRLGMVSSSCGMCGAEAIEALTKRLEPLASSEPWDLEMVTTVGDAVEPQQELFDATGSAHAAAAFDREGQVLLVREDIGRHNAVDKVVGALALHERRNGEGLGLFVSGRASFEMVQKAWSAGFSVLVAVSGPSALAIETAKAANLTLVGFARNGGGTFYS